MSGGRGDWNECRRAKQAPEGYTEKHGTHELTYSKNDQSRIRPHYS
jgi:hypothetical protein